MFDYLEIIEACAVCAWLALPVALEIADVLRRAGK